MVTNPGAVRGRGLDKWDRRTLNRGCPSEKGRGLERGKEPSKDSEGWGEKGGRVGKGVFSGGAPPGRLDCGEGPERDQSGRER